MQPTYQTYAQMVSEEKEGSLVGKSLLVTGFVACATAAVLLLVQTPTEQNLYVTSPALTASRVVAQYPRGQTLHAQGSEGEESLAELMARSQELLQADGMDFSSQVQTLDDDDVEIPSKGQLKRIRRMGHVDVSAYQKHGKDTGSCEVQVVRITARIASLADHLKINKKDFAATRRIMELTSERRKLLNYLWKRDPGAVVDLVQDLQIRWRTPDKIAKLVPRSGPVEILVPESPVRPRTIPKANQPAA